MTTFDALGLSAPLIRSVEKQNFTTPTEIQSLAIPAQLAGRDVMGLAQTGGGKTAAFLLPLIQTLMAVKGRPEPGRPKAVILAPTRELASQIGLAFHDFAKGSPLSHTVICGGMPFRPQMSALKRGVDVLIATPGRLLDHWRRDAVAFDTTGVLILDEADRMLDMGFVDDVRAVAGAMPADRQTVMFSATMAPAIAKLAGDILNDPVRVEAERKSTVADTIDHKVMYLAHHDKPALLRHLLETLERERVLVFAKTKIGSEKLAKALRDEGFRVDAIHGDKRQRERDRTLRAFRENKIDILVATDVAARGIDVAGVSHVINFDLPMEPEAYVHRCGRTGRAGASGVAISFCGKQDVGLLKAIERLLKTAVEVDADQPFHQMHAKAAKTKSNKPFRGRGKAGKSNIGKPHFGKPKGKPGKRAAVGQKRGDQRQRPERKAA